MRFAAVLFVLFVTQSAMCTVLPNSKPSWRSYFSPRVKTQAVDKAKIYDDNDEPHSYREIALRATYVVAATVVVRYVVRLALKYFKKVEAGTTITTLLVEDSSKVESEVPVPAIESQHDVIGTFFDKEFKNLNGKAVGQMSRSSTVSLVFDNYPDVLATAGSEEYDRHAQFIEWFANRTSAANSTVIYMSKNETRHSFEHFPGWHVPHYPSLQHQVNWEKILREKYNVNDNEFRVVLLEAPSLQLISDDALEYVSLMGTSTLKPTHIFDVLAGPFLKCNSSMSRNNTQSPVQVIDAVIGEHRVIARDHSFVFESLLSNPEYHDASVPRNSSIYGGSKSDYVAVLFDGSNALLSRQGMDASAVNASVLLKIAGHHELKQRVDTLLKHSMASDDHVEVISICLDSNEEDYASYCSQCPYLVVPFQDTTKKLLLMKSLGIDAGTAPTLVVFDRTGREIDRYLAADLMKDITTRVTSANVTGAEKKKSFIFPWKKGHFDETYRQSGELFSVDTVECVSKMQQSPALVAFLDDSPAGERQIAGRGAGAEAMKVLKRCLYLALKKLSRIERENAQPVVIPAHSRSKPLLIAHTALSFSSDVPIPISPVSSLFHELLRSASSDDSSNKAEGLLSLIQLSSGRYCSVPLPSIVSFITGDREIPLTADALAVVVDDLVIDIQQWVHKYRTFDVPLLPMSNIPKPLDGNTPPA